MTWTGLWQNQYGSKLKVNAASDGRLEGTFESAVDPGTRGNPVSIVGVYHGDLISFAFAGPPDHRMVVAWTGLLREGRMETLWHVTRSEQLMAEKEGAPAVRKQLGVWESTTTGADTFQRIE